MSISLGSLVASALNVPLTVSLSMTRVNSFAAKVRTTFLPSLSASHLPCSASFLSPPAALNPTPARIARSRNQECRARMVDLRLIRVRTQTRQDDHPSWQTSLAQVEVLFVFACLDLEGQLGLFVVLWRQ